MGCDGAGRINVLLRRLSGVPETNCLVKGSRSETRSVGMNTTELTPASCPNRVARTFPDATSQSSTVLSSKQDATRVPSGLNATRSTPASRPVHVDSGLPDAASHTRTVLSLDPETRRVPFGLNWT